MIIEGSLTSRVLPPTILPVLFVEASVQLTGTVKEVGSITVTEKVLLMVGVNVPPLTPLIVMVSPVFKPCGPAVVTRHGLLT